MTNAGCHGREVGARGSHCPDEGRFCDEGWCCFQRQQTESQLGGGLRSVMNPDGMNPDGIREDADQSKTQAARGPNGEKSPFFAQDAPCLHAAVNCDAPSKGAVVSSRAV